MRYVYLPSLELIFYLICEQNTSGNQKMTVYKWIVQVLLPEHHAFDPSKSGDHVKSKIE